MAAPKTPRPKKVKTLTEAKFDTSFNFGANAGGGKREKKTGKRKDGSNWSA